MLWTLAALWTRTRLAMIQASADRWFAENIRLTKAAEDEAKRKPGNGRSLISAAEQRRQDRKVHRMEDQAERAESKLYRRLERCAKLKARLHTLTKPRTLAGAASGFLTAITALTVAHSAGVDINNVIDVSKEHVAYVISEVQSRVNL